MHLAVPHTPPSLPPSLPPFLQGYPPPQHESLSMRALPQRWEVRVLVVKQNYLLEYLPNQTEAPLGCIHLEVRR